MTHTPGPWRSTEKFRSASIQIYGANSHTVLFTVHASKWHDDVMDNAHLIEAAPELLAACETIYDELDERGWARCPAEEAIMAILEKAIAKARGETR